jgi:hypothetical protein
MLSSVIPARLDYQCGHAALVSLPRIKGESSAQRNARVAREKSSARVRQCDFCGPTVEIVRAEAPPAVDVVAAPVAAELFAAAVAELAVSEVVVAAGAPIAAEVVAAEVVALPVADAVAALAESGAEVVGPPRAAESPLPGVEPVGTVETPQPNGATNGHVDVEVPQAVVARAVRRRRVPKPVPNEQPAAASQPVTVTVTVTPPVKTRRPRRAASPARRYVARFLVERVLEAVDIRDALRQVESSGAVEVLAINRLS